MFFRGASQTKYSTFSLVKCTLLPTHPYTNDGTTEDFINDKGPCRGRSVTFKTFKTCILDEWPLKPLKSHLGPLLTCFFDVLTCIFLISIFSVLRVMFFEVVIADHQSRVLTRPFQRIGSTRLKSHPTHWQASQYAADTLPKHFEKFFTASKEFPTAC